MANRVGLTRQPTTANGHEDVECAGGLGQLERLAKHHARGLAAEVVLEAALVDGDLAVARLEPDAGHRFLRRPVA